MIISSIFLKWLNLFFRCSDLCIVFTELCNTLMFFFTNEPNSVLGDFNTINLLLMCATHKEYEVFSKSFTFWMNLSEAVYTNTNCDKLCEKLSNFVYPLVDCITKHCQLELRHVTKRKTILNCLFEIVKFDVNRF